MLTRLFSAKGLTLVELIIATVLVSVVMLGIVAINLSLNDSGQGAAQRQVVKSQAQIMLNYMLNDAALAVGSSNTDAFGQTDLGILYPGCSVARWGQQIGCTMCFHQSPSGGDIWKCYTLNYPGMVAGEDYQVYSCTMPYQAGTNYPRGAVNCQYPGGFGIALTTGPTYVGTLHDFADNFTTSPLLFTLTVNACLDNSAATCNAGGQGVSGDPANNPQVLLTGSVIPMQSSGG